ncbi:MAG: beta strand repeat-containing protein, partial [Candidatus Binataceae bacterium]
MRLCWAASMMTAALVVGLVSCSSGSSTGTFNPTPILGCGQNLNPNCALFPTNITAGSQNFTLFINGSGFISKANGNLGNSTATWNGSPRPTTLNVNSGQLNVTIYSTDVATAGEAQVGIINPAPGGGPSNNNVTFTINAPKSGGPVLSSLNPATVGAGSGAFTLTVSGSNFISSDVVTWNG